MGSERKSEKSSCPCRCTDIPTQWKSEERATITSASSCSSPKSRTAEGSMPCFVSCRRSLSAMFATIWMCTQEWSLISIRTTAFTFATCHQPFSCLSSFTRSSSFRSLRLPRTGRLMCIFSTACAGVSLVSRTASADTGSSMRSSVFLSSSLMCAPPRCARTCRGMTGCGCRGAATDGRECPAPRGSPQERRREPASERPPVPDR